MALGPSGKTMANTLGHVFAHIGETKLWDLLLGVSCIVVLLCLRKLGELHARRNTHLKSKNEEGCRRLLPRLAWLLSIARNAVVVMLASLLVLVLEYHYVHPFTTTETVPVGFPAPQLPPFRALAGTAGNGTAAPGNGSVAGVLELSRRLGVGLLVVPLVSVIECMAIAKAFASRSRRQDPSQELVALGACNLVGSLFSSYTVTGSFSRTALNHASGAATPIAGVITCVFVVIALGSLTPYFRYIPTAALSAVIICAVVFMIDWKIVPSLWRSRKPDLVPLLVTFLVGLFWRLEYGILLGTGVSLLLLLHRAARPKISLTVRQTPSGSRYLLVVPDCGLNYPAAEHLRERILGAAWTPAAPSAAESPSAAPTAPPITTPAALPIAESTAAKETESAAQSAPDTGELPESAEVIPGRREVPGVKQPAWARSAQVERPPSPERGQPGAAAAATSGQPDQRSNGHDSAVCRLQVTSDGDVTPRRSSVGGESSAARPTPDRERGSAPLLPVVLNCRNIRYTDFTAAKSMAAAAHSLERAGGRPLLLLHVKPSVLAVWRGVDRAAFTVCQSEAEADQLIDGGDGRCGEEGATRGGPESADVTRPFLDAASPSD